LYHEQHQERNKKKEFAKNDGECSRSVGSNVMKTGEIVRMEELEEFSFFRSSEFGKFLSPFHSSDNITTMGVGGFPDEKNDQDELRLEFGRTRQILPVLLSAVFRPGFVRTIGPVEIRRNIRRPFWSCVSPRSVTRDFREYFLSF
jgi:hypothetical protein